MDFLQNKKQNASLSPIIIFVEIQPGQVKEAVNRNVDGRAHPEGKNFIV
jgi:hypothetical protein